MQTAVIPEIFTNVVSYLDPTGQVQVDERQMAARISSVEGTTVALLDNANDTSSFFFQSLAEILQSEYGVSNVILESKFTSTKPATKELIQEMSDRSDFMVAGVCL